ncbi:hypothetical protein ESCO_002086 [Escovopsis weberi]|uniref:N-acetyltransferase domain-containing protein n=1 Tax=Escovopsis weberi TaxID=150374 RepID=A0A0M9VWV4_ESCWE|nr:hypothetical protein ESCO_002086 [Escovopsis weberi]
MSSHTTNGSNKSNISNNNNTHDANTKPGIDPSLFRVRRARDVDVPAMAALEVSAFLDSPMHKAMFPERLRIKPGIQDQVEWNTTRMRRGLADPGLTFLVVAYRRPGEGEIIVGSAEWAAPVDDEAARREARKGVAEKAGDIERRLNGLPPCLDKGVVVEAATEVMKLLERSQEAYREKNRHRTWTLNSICVDGDYRGLGIGKMLTRWGMERAEHDKADIWVVSPPPGRPLYDGLGFSLVAQGQRLGEPQYVMLKLYDGPQ